MPAYRITSKYRVEKDILIENTNDSSVYLDKINLYEYCYIEPNFRGTTPYVVVC